MGTTVEKLNKVLETKEAIRTSINNKGGTLTESDTFSSYVTAIDNIQTGSKNEPITITENGTYTAPEGTGYSPVNVNVSGGINQFQTYIDLKQNLSFSFFSSMNDEMLEQILNGISLRNITTASGMFQSCSSLTTIPLIDTSKVTGYAGEGGMMNMFYNCSSLITIPLLNTSNVVYMDDMFRGCSSLISIPALDVSNASFGNYMFLGCTNLEEIHMTGMKSNFSIFSSTKFTESALVEILNNLATVTSTKTLSMGGTNLAKLTDEEKAIATNKGWTLA